MTPTSHRPVTRIAHHTNDAIYVRDADLVADLMGKLSFTEMMFFQLMGKRPSPQQTKILDAVLVTLMEHGLTPSVIAARMIQMSCPESIQAAIAGGLLCVGSTFVGTMEGCAVLIEEILASSGSEAAAAQTIAQRHRVQKKPVPGFGHPLHRPDDPRTPRLFAIAEEAGVSGHHIRALKLLAQEIDSAWGRHLTINATGAIAALLGEIGIPRDVMRGIAVVSRAAGLVGHIREEQLDPAARHLWETAETVVPFESGLAR